MLIRILSDNPGPTFTRNIDSKFVSTIKDVLRNCRDPSVQQSLRETIMTLYRDKAYDTNLSNLFAMWQKEGAAGSPPGPSNNVIPGHMPQYPDSHTRSGDYSASRSRNARALPPPAELSQRIEEARTSAKLLQQLVQSTPQAEIRSNELINEFADRCQSAQRSIQSYIQADDPHPDDDTMATLIETSDLLSSSISKHSRAILQARRAAAGGNSPATTPPLPSRPEEQPQRGNGTLASATYTPSGFQPELSAYSLPPIPRPVGTQNEVPPANVAHTYSPPPIPPPNVARKEVAPTGHSYSPPPIAPMGRQAGPIPDDPFADEHATGEGEDQQHNRYFPPPVGTSRPGMANVTSSYVRRQDDAEENFTMHGGRDSAPVSPEIANAELRRSVGEVSPVEARTKH
jgi:hypothetical protein